jgi:valyl-tRNA synthetase
MNDDASMNSNVPDKYVGLSREDARKAVVTDLKSEGLLHKIEDYVNKVGYSERGHVPIESYLSEQWFMKMEELAKPALDAVNNGDIQFHPTHWTKTYNHWLGNIKDWCISRQLWWGHQIPVWVHKKDPSNIHVSVEGPEDPENWDRDPDVLDTWASSWLWPMGVHAWPSEDENLKKFYPTDAIVTGPDIIFFWVARMIMTGYEFMGELPFKDVYFTSILRDETGRKLSKSLGNSPNPFDLFDEYGTDAVRFGTLLMAPQGSDVLFSKDRLDIGRNFMNKLWNACRFVQMNIPENWSNEIEIESIKLDLPEKWILSRLSKTIDEYNHQLDRFHFNEAAKVLYDFTWNDFCDWYVEIAKTRFYGHDESKADVARTVALKCIRTILALLHPFSPFITEELWSHFKKPKAPDLIVAPWPKKESNYNDQVEKEMSLFQEVITAIRSIRSRMNVPPSKFSNLVVRCDAHQSLFLNNHVNLLKSLARINEITMGESIDKPSQSATVVVDGMEIFILLGGLVDLEKEKARMEKRIKEIERLISGINGKLSNENFVNRAPDQVIAKERSNLIKLTDEFEKVMANLEMLQ